MFFSNQISLFLVMALVGVSYGWSLFKIEMPDYQVLSKIGGNVEIRKYPQLKWAATSFDGKVQDMKMNNMFWKLFGYISGENDQKTKIEMTAPVTTVFKSSDNKAIGMASNAKMTMRFYVPKADQSNTPNPTGDAFLQVDPEAEYATIRFGGWASMNDNLSYRDQLIKALGAEASKYDTVNFLAAGYDSPFNFIGRRNEVWLKKL